MIEDLAEIGYDPNNLFFATYDWRLSFKDLEKRDHYFTSLKYLIEMAYEKNQNQPTVIVSHSLGGTLVIYFMQWVSQPDTGGPNWLNKYVKGFVNIGGTLLGVPKAVSALVSGVIDF